MAKPVCAIFGVGPGNGMACARKFDSEGHTVALCSRNGDAMREAASTLKNSRGFACDVSDEAAIRSAVEEISGTLGPVDTLIYNAGSAAWGNADRLSKENLRSDFDVNALGLFTAAKSVLPAMRANGRGTIIVIGASAALRGRPDSISFAAAKSAQRSIAQSLARQLGPEGIHVCYLVLDGVVGLETTRLAMPDKPDEFFLSASGVAEAAFMLSQQDRQAWSFEVDLRPFGENW
jgi:NADP-dependent 3-hydroxy acid dehydrogenase YdfG